MRNWPALPREQVETSRSSAGRWARRVATVVAGTLPCPIGRATTPAVPVR
jgi:hypothetical protein